MVLKGLKRLYILIIMYKLLFIVHVTVKGLLKSYTVVQKTKHLKLQQWAWYILSFYKDSRLQVSMQINEVLLYKK